MTAAFPAPFVLKPVAEGSSVGVHIVRAGDNRALPAGFGRSARQVLVEAYIPGRELTCAVLEDGGRHAAQPLCRRWRSGRATPSTPTTASTPTAAACTSSPRRCPLRYSLREMPGRSALGGASGAGAAAACPGPTSATTIRRCYQARPTGCLYILETNTQPGMTPTSLVPEIAASAGIAFPALVAGLMEGARCDG